MELKKYKLGDIADIISGVAFQPSDICNEGVRILRGGNIQSQRIIIKDDDVFLPLYYINEENQVKIGDTILVASTGSVEVLGKAATCFDDMKNTQIGAFLRIIRPKEERYSMLISIALNSWYFAKYIKAQARGTSINNITIGYLKEFEIYCPNNYLSICDFYQTLEKKIALNRKINDNLEAMAKQLYDYWFVQFDFPNEEGKPYKSSGGKMVWNEKLKREIPEGWEVEKLGDIIQELESGKRPKGGIEKSLKQGIPSLGAEAISKLGDFDYSKTPYIPYNTKINSGIIKNNDILIYKDGAYVGKVTLYRDNFPFEFATINEHVFLLRTTDPKIQEYIFFTLEKDYFFNIMQNLGKAKAAQPGLNKDDLKSIEILSPKKEIIYKYRTIIEPLMANLFNSAKQIANLTKQRDELLTLLMNGQVSVNYD